MGLFGLDGYKGSESKTLLLKVITRPWETAVLLVLMM